MQADHRRRADARRRLPPHAAVRDAAPATRNLCRLITARTSARALRATAGRSRPRAGGRAGPAEASRRSLADVERHAEGLVCLSGCAARRPAGARGSSATTTRGAARAGGGCCAPSGAERFRVELQRPFWRHDRRRNRLLAELAERLGVPVRRHRQRPRPRRARARAAGRVRGGAAGRDARRDRARGGAATPRTCWPRPSAMAERFRDHPDAVAETRPARRAARFDLTERPRLPLPGRGGPGRRPQAGRALPARGSTERYAGRAARAEAEARLDEELRVIRHLGLSGFFLLHRDMLELAREVAVEVRGPDSARALLPPGRGRGSSVVLDRLLPHRPLARRPDRERALPRPLPQRGADGAAGHRPRLPARHPRGADPARARALRRRALGAGRGVRRPTRCASAVRDFGKALGLPPGEIERAGARRSTRGSDRERHRHDEAIGARRPARRAGRRSCRLAREALGLPRHVSQHPGGMVISTQPLIDLCPIQPAAMEGRQMVQWDKDSCADAGFLKIDLLGLGMLSAVERCVDEIARVRGERIDLSRIAYDDKEVYDEIQQAETMGVFQIESRAQMQMLKRTRPEIARRPDGAGGARAARARSRAAPCTPTSSGASALRADPDVPGAVRAPVARAGAEATRSARSSSRTR